MDLNSSMDLPHKALKRFGITLLPVDVPKPWSAWLLPVCEFPLTPQLFAPYASFFSLLHQRLLKDAGMEHNVLLQTWKLGSKTGTAILDEHAAEWSLDIGMGIWPDREPPQGWTEDSIQDAAAAVYRGEEPNLPVHRILHLTLPQEPLCDAARQMRGLGVQFELFSAGSIEEIAKQGREVLLPMVKDRRFRKAALYLPLIDQRTLCHPDAAEKLDAWMCGIDVYVRESAEDRGILMLSKLPLDFLFEQA